MKFRCRGGYDNKCKAYSCIKYHVKEKEDEKNV